MNCKVSTSNILLDIPAVSNIVRYFELSSSSPKLGDFEKVTIEI